MAWKELGKVRVSYDSAHRHYAASKIRAYGTVSASGLTDSTYYYLYVSPMHSGSVPARQGRNFDITYSVSQSFEYAWFTFGPSETYPDVTLSNAGAAVAEWGAKATAIAYLTKTSGFINPSNPEIINARVTQSGGYYEPYTVSGGTCYFKESTAETYSSFSFTGGSIDFSGILTGGKTYNVYVVETLDDNSTATSPTYTFSTVDGTPSVTPVSPINKIVYGTADFKWLYENTNGTQQYAYDLDISEDDSTWQTLVSHTVSAETSYSCSIATSGKFYWRVRGYNQDDVASAWSASGSFVNYISPDAPTDVNVTGTGRVTVTWSTNDQIAYQVKVGRFDSGWVYSAEKSFFLNEYLENGDYLIMVRIMNSLGIASDWAETVLHQEMSVLEPSATVTMREGYNEIVVTSSGYEHVYIIRNGVVIAEMNGEAYFDYHCNGDDEYIIRGVMADDTFADYHMVGDYTCRKPALIDRLNNVLYVNERLDEEPAISSSHSIDVASVQYVGRTKPVHHVGKIHTRTWTVTCAQNIEVGKIYFYRNFRGDKAWVICSNVQSALNSLGVHEYSFTLEETDHSEGIDYAV